MASNNDTKRDHLTAKQRVSVTETSFLAEVMKADPAQPTREISYQFTGRNFVAPINPYE